VKKLFYVIPIASILLFSCAGTPKNSGNQTLESVSEQTDSQTAPNDEAYSERNDNHSVLENTVETTENSPAQENTIDADTEKESAAETDYIDETEPLSEM
jgi:lipoprotein